MKEQNFELLAKYVYNLTSDSEEIEVKKILQNPLEILSYNTIIKDKNKFDSYQDYMNWLDKEDKTSWEKLKAKIIKSKNIHFNFDFSIFIDALEKIEDYLENFIPNAYTYSFAPNFESNDEEQDVLFRIREASLKQTDFNKLLLFLEEQSQKKVVIVFDDEKINLDANNASQLHSIFHKAKDKNEHFKITFI